MGISSNASYVEKQRNKGKTMDELLRVEGLKKYFKTPHGLLHAVDDVDFSISKGETLGVVGESGCGKSTLGRVVIKLLPATDGEVYFKGEEILAQKDSIKLRKSLQMIFQDPFSSLNPRMTVGEIIGEPMRINKICPKGEIDERVSSLMDTVGLASRYVNYYPHELDGGRRQRIGIARALALEPEFIVCDEPVSALDVSIQAQIINLMQDLQEERGFSYMFITHDLSVVRHISNNIMVMYMGKVVEKAPTEELFSNTIHPYTKALLAAIPLPVVHKGEIERPILRGEITSPIDPKPGCRFASRCPFATDMCKEKTPCLVEIRKSHFVACHRAKEFV